MTEDRRRGWALTAVLIAEALNLLDSTIVQVATPAIGGDLHATPGQLQWLTAGYTLPFAVLLVTGGRLGDIFGRRRVFTTGMGVFVACSALCALSPGMAVLLGARVLQGAGAALVVPQTFGLIRARFTGPARAAALGAIGPVMAFAAVAGPVLGGLLTDAWGWRSVFLVTVPLGLVVLALTPTLREDRATRAPRLDLAGTALLAFATGSLIYPLIQGHDSGWAPWTWAALALGLVLLGGFVAQPRLRRSDPLVEPGLFRDRVFPASLVTSAAFFSVMNGLLFVLVLFLQSTGRGALFAGLAMLPWSIGLGAGSVLAGVVLVPRFGARVMPFGLLFILAGLLATAILLRTPGEPWRIAGPLLVTGTGLGLFTTPFFSTALGRVRDHEAGSASGLLNAVQQFGATLGVAILGSVYFGDGARLAIVVAIAVEILVLALTPILTTTDRGQAPAEPATQRA